MLAEESDSPGLPGDSMRSHGSPRPTGQPPSPPRQTSASSTDEKNHPREKKKSDSLRLPLSLVWFSPAAHTLTVVSA